jgi:hypothetical protein
VPVSDKTLRLYRKWRRLRPELTSARALDWARYEIAQDEMLARFGLWSWEDRGYGTFASIDYESWSCSDVASTPDGHPLTVRMMVGNDDSPDEGIDWGDATPEEIEQTNAARSTFYVAIVVEDRDGTEIFRDGIDGVDVIDLPGYLQRDWEDAAAYALIEHLDLEKALRIATSEAGERAYWAARDVVTV